MRFIPGILEDFGKWFHLKFGPKRIFTVPFGPGVGDVFKAPCPGSPDEDKSYTVTLVSYHPGKIVVTMVE